MANVEAKQTTTTTNKGAQSFDKWLCKWERGIIGEVCQVLGVTRQSIAFWRTGQVIPGPEMRAAIARMSQGEVPEMAWLSPEYVKEVTLLNKRVDTFLASIN